MEQQVISRDLEYHFTDEEKLDMSKQLASENQNKRKLEDQKKAVTSQYGSQIAEKQETINQLSDKLAAGYEFRRTECSVQWHTPDKNQKTITRSDTGESWTEKMNEYDHDLFNQWEEKQNTAEEDFENSNVRTDEESEEYTDSVPEGEEEATGGQNDLPFDNEPEPAPESQEEVFI